MYRTRTQSMEIPCSEMNCNLESVKVISSENFMNYNIFISQLSEDSWQCAKTVAFIRNNKVI